MSYEAELKTLVSVFRTGWSTTPYANVTVAYPSLPFAKPGPHDDWLRFSVLHGEENAVSMGTPGANVYRHIGVVSIDVFVAKGKGIAAALRYADAALGIFRTYNAGGIRCIRTAVRNHGTDLDPGWYAVTASAWFARDSLF